MTKKKNIASKLVLVLFVLTLISCCLLGSTFARYVSGGTGSASVGIAKWDVGMAEGSMTIDVDKISPSQEEKGAHNGDDPRTHKATPAKAIATITNNSDVSAKVTVTLSDLSFKKGDQRVDFGTTDLTSWTDGTSKPSQKDMMDTVQLQFAIVEDAATAPENTAWEALTYDADGSYEVDTATLSAKTSTADYVNIWFRVVWVSQDGTTYADELDTWIGENVETISATLSYTAEQASELPTT